MRRLETLKRVRSGWPRKRVFPPFFFQFLFFLIKKKAEPVAGACRRGVVRFQSLEQGVTELRESEEGGAGGGRGGSDD